MDEKQVRFWADPGHAIIIYLVLAFISQAILRLGSQVLIVIFIILMSLSAYAFSQLDKYLTPEEKKAQKDYENWMSGQRGP